jgi:hypothetical protein
MKNADLTREQGRLYIRTWGMIFWEGGGGLSFGRYHEKCRFDEGESGISGYHREKKLTIIQLGVSEAMGQLATLPLNNTY